MVLPTVKIDTFSFLLAHACVSRQLPTLSWAHQVISGCLENCPLLSKPMSSPGNQQYKNTKANQVLNSAAKSALSLPA